MNSMPNTVNSNLFLFVDDEKLYRETTSDKNVEMLQEDLGKLDEWSKKTG